MHIESIQDILSRVEQPSRYLGSEINRIRKNPDTVQLKVLLAFPDLYEIGTSHFGIQILYHVLNRDSDILAERVFAPGLDMARELKKAGLPLFSLESETPAGSFDIIGFSLLYELNYTNVLAMLDLAGIPFRAKDRTRDHPLIIAGGPCTCNPEPMADFFDAMVIGDGETVVMDMARAWKCWKANGGRKMALLEDWAAIGGVYVPRFYHAQFDANGFCTLRPDKKRVDKVPESVSRAVISDLGKSPFPDKPIVPFSRPVHDRLRLEVARGCTRGCRFCQAGMIYRPVRERTLDQLLKQTEKSLAATGYEDLSLLSLSTGDYGCILALMQKLMAKGESNHVAVSFPSLRAGTLNPQLMELVKKVRKTGFTIAAEAGSQRLRDLINKNIGRQDLYNTVENAFRYGWQVIKLYFMIGLPTETQQDLAEMVSLVREIHKIRGPNGKKGKINVSVNTFIPKPHTPFQWASQIPVTESREKLGWIKDKLRLPGLHVKWQNPETSFLEGLWARGDRTLTRLLETAYEMGCQFDGWSDHFKNDRWMRALERQQVDIDFYTTRTRQFDEPLPWDHIDSRVTKAYLQKEWHKAIAGEETTDCRTGDCSNCGVCDFETIRPIVYSNVDPGAADKEAISIRADEFMKTVRVRYAKTGPARFFGHLEMVSIFLRALRRAAIPVQYSQGYHPLPKISFEDPLPIGIESRVETFRIRVPGSFRTNNLVAALNAQLPEGLILRDCQVMGGKPPKAQNSAHVYTVTAPLIRIDEQALTRFEDAPEFPMQRRNKKGKVITIDLKAVVEKLTLLTPGQVEMTIVNDQGRKVRPAAVLTHVFNFSDDDVKACRIVKTQTRQ
ncbi:MAG: TIGR03960 family B12-binding radical SAM protein [Deltaproteobacteria bacterium]|nr:TIGR03960 family B12-binding radical SAM protein [Deltaproteobacteria bacterium]